MGGRDTRDSRGLRRTWMPRAAIFFLLMKLPCISSGALRTPRRLEPSVDATLSEDMETSRVSPGDQLNDYYSCPYAIYSEEEALARKENGSALGNAVTVSSSSYGRLGNHFATTIVNFAVAYCCKSRLLTLPSKDDLMESSIFGNGKRGTVWFDLSSAPDTQDFDSSTCTVDIEWANREAFKTQYLVEKDSESYNPALAHCARHAPRLVGCEQAYFMPQGLANVCPGKTSASVLQKSESTDDGAGNLVIHIRSGDVFGDPNPHPGYGQPPLKFFIMVMLDRPWKKIDVVTWAEEEKELHPAVPVLRALVDQGVFGETEVNIYTDRSLDDDLRTMFCADAIATAKSTMVFLTAYHTAASTVYLPMTCDDYRRSLHPIDRPGVEVFGVAGVEEYTPFDRWHNTPEQREEVVTFLDISLERC